MSASPSRCPRLARTRPVFRGLRPRFPRRPSRAGQSGLARTRPVFRGLRHLLLDLFRPDDLILARTRPVFRGLRHLVCHLLPIDVATTACKDETRFQGIATRPGSPWRPGGRRSWLARTRPVFRGLRPFGQSIGWSGQYTRLARTRPVFRGLRRWLIPVARIAGLAGLQGRDPFSGDCDSYFPRSRFRSSRSQLARTRPVFRGLRQEALDRVRRVESETCKDETRFQGIATRGAGPRSPRGVRDLQGRDPFSGDCDVPVRRDGVPRTIQLARTRPVFRGLRSRGAPRFPPPARSDLQGRDPFSGDCDFDLHSQRIANHLRRGLQGRNPFSGDCEPGLLVTPGGGFDDACKDETRFQGMATARRGGR